MSSLAYCSKSEQAKEHHTVYAGDDATIMPQGILALLSWASCIIHACTGFVSSTKTHQNPWASVTHRSCGPINAIVHVLALCNMQACTVMKAPHQRGILTVMLTYFPGSPVTAA